eukprot:TRINITY_DN2864_c0_g2_i1.p1 TRINITY_DN2864_c0_g2~~TRINITY_DN2864_c0_g2_i1.p1  ORF type:complete len:985 (+),score=231.08 TRINITY_DN2864_c0_g2_i1:171-2957(+)
MAGDASGAKDFIEGWAKEGKPLDRIMQSSQLLQIQSEIKKEEVEVNKLLTKEIQDLALLQNELNHCNEQFVEKARRLEQIRSQQIVNLDSDAKNQIVGITRKALDTVLVPRPKKEEERNKPATVDVRFLPGNESAGNDLRLGGEGAGSRDAKFTVQLNQKVQTLAKQAAKYWGLDANKVFFLDRDGRIVPDSMVLSDIILPHSAPTSSASSAAPAPVGRRSFSGEGELELAQQTDEDSYTILGRNYSLTLVRATTVLDKDDLNKPKGETWNDFTFNATALAQELEATRKKRGDGDDGGPSAEALEAIPSLYDLIQQGLKKKAKKRADTRCRWIEFTMFVLAFSLNFILLLSPPSEAWIVRMRLTNEYTSMLLFNFTNAERSSVHARSFLEVSSKSDLKRWLNGPLSRSLGIGQQRGLLKASNLAVLGAVGYVFESDGTQVSGINWCPVPSVSPAAGACSNASNASNASGNGSNASNATTACSSNASNATGVQASQQAKPPPGVPPCIPREFLLCSNPNTIQIFNQAIKGGLTVPTCMRPYHLHSLSTWTSSIGQGEFIFTRGEIDQYVSGRTVSFDWQYNETNATAWMASYASFYPKEVEPLSPARALVLYIYDPSLNGVLVKWMIAENTLSGGLVTSERTSVLKLDAQSAYKDAGYASVTVLAAVCLLMELRRILGWPRSWTFEDERDRCGFITIIFLLLPVVLIAGFGLYRARCTLDASTLVGQPTAQVTSALFSMRTLDDYTKGVDMLILIMLNVLLWRYLLMFFPQLVSLTEMVKKVAKPLTIALVLILTALVCFTVTFYALYSTDVYVFRNEFAAIMATLQFALGGVGDWTVLADAHRYGYVIVMIVAFALLGVILTKLPVAIMLSFNKESDLFENASYHYFWASEHGGQAGETHFNPATIGWDFTSGQPVQVEAQASQTAAS